VGLYVDRNFMLGLIVGVGSVWAFHRFVRPMPSKANG
jgi:hypothetical protein